MNQAKIVEEIAYLSTLMTHNYPELLRLSTRAVRVARQLFGDQSEEVKVLNSLRDHYEMQIQQSPELEKDWREAMWGFLRDFQQAIDNGLLGTLRVAIQGEVLGDFLMLSKQFRDDGQFAVSAVLAAAGLEDAMKRCARNAGITLPDKADLSTAANALITKRLIEGAEKAMVHGLFPFRNNALHADFAKITEPSLQSAIGFLEGFLQKHF
jgi:hypothetical protein